jgi:hypothetical protein
MTQNDTPIVRAVAFLLLATVCLAQCANFSRIRNANGATSHAGQTKVLQADGPLPPPPPPKLGFKSLAIS